MELAKMTFLVFTSTALVLGHQVGVEDLKELKLFAWNVLPPSFRRFTPTPLFFTLRLVRARFLLCCLLR